MIIVYVNSMEDTSQFDALYEGVKDCTLLYNPTRREVVELLSERPGETLLCFGHGTSRGLFDVELTYYIIDWTMTPLLRDREVIGLWCFASSFAKTNGLTGFFTHMFISNSLECSQYGCGDYSDEVIFEQNRKFADKINFFLNNDVPAVEWIDMLMESGELQLPFVEYNYKNLSYLVLGADIVVDDI